MKLQKCIVRAAAMSFALLLGSVTLVTTTPAVARTSGLSQAVVGDIDPSATATFTLTKLSGPTSSTSASGKPIQGLPNAAVAGVEFSIQQVTGFGGSCPVAATGSLPVGSMTTAQDWANATALVASLDPVDPNEAIETMCLGANISCVTGSNGVCLTSGGKVPNLPLGLYLVTEVDVPSNGEGGWSPSQPFLVSVPMLDPVAQDAWLYDIFVYPKNTHLAISKTADASKAPSVGGVISYLIDAEVPVTPVKDQSGNITVAQLSGYQITDDLPKEVDYVSSQVKLNGKVVDSSNYDLSITNNLFKVQFKDPSGLALLQQASDQAYAANQVAPLNPKVSLTISAKVNPLLNSDGSSGVGVDGLITNTATLYPDAKSISSGVGITSAPVSTSYGGVMLHKHDSTTNAAVAGATFSVYPSETDAIKRTNRLTAQTRQLAPASSFVTDASGEVAVVGLRYDANHPDCYLDSNGTATFGTAPLKYPASAKPGTSYWLAETKAPVGYKALVAPIQFCLVNVLDGDAAGVSYDDWVVLNDPISNKPLATTAALAKSVGQRLSRTGVGLPLIGVAVAAVGVGTGLVRRRRTN
jgi:fimbrial isopeptide formation D2 family protein